jgi:LacI family transcriptional regulator
MNPDTRRERPTLARVAKLAGVAESTASRVLNGYTRGFRVRPEVRQRVLRAAADLNYKPNPMVRSISAKRTNLVAIVGWASDGVNRTAVQEAVRLLMAGGKHVCTTFLQPDANGHDLPSWRVDGALVVRARVEKDLEELEGQQLPYVSINGLTGPGGDSVTFNEADGMGQAIDHLVSLGHTRIAYGYVRRERHGGPGTPHAAVATRRTAYLEHLERHGLTPLAGYDHDDIDYIDFVRTYLANDRASAVVAYDDSTALFIIQSLDQLGLRVPDDLSVVAFNDELPARMATPPLTTVSIPAAEAGRRAAELLLERLASEEPVATRHVVLKETLVVRRSSSEPNPNP